MNLIIIRKMADGQWRATNEPDTYEQGRGIHLPEIPTAFGSTPQEALTKLLQ